MLSTNLILQAYDESFELLVNEFVEIYYTDEEWYSQDYYIIWEWGRLAPDVVGIGDYFWNITDMYESLKHNIPKDTLFDWYDYCLDQHIENDKLKEEWKKPLPITNLVHYHKWAPKYTKEELKKSEDNVKEAEKMFKDILFRSKKNDNN